MRFHTIVQELSWHLRSKVLVKQGAPVVGGCHSFGRRLYTVYWRSHSKKTVASTIGEVKEREKKGESCLDHLGLRLFGLVARRTASVALNFWDCELIATTRWLPLDLAPCRMFTIATAIPTTSLRGLEHAAHTCHCSVSLLSALPPCVHPANDRFTHQQNVLMATDSSCARRPAARGSGFVSTEWSDGNR